MPSAWHLLVPRMAGSPHPYCLRAYSGPVGFDTAVSRLAAVHTQRSCSLRACSGRGWWLWEARSDPHQSHGTPRMGWNHSGGCEEPAALSHSRQDTRTREDLL